MEQCKPSCLCEHLHLPDCLVATVLARELLLAVLSLNNRAQATVEHHKPVFGLVVLLIERLAGK